MICQETILSFTALSDNTKSGMVKGRVAQALYMLQNAGKGGVTQLEFLKATGGTRLSAAIHLLRRKYDLDIFTIEVPNNYKGFHAKYILHDKINLINKE